ncbi:cob(I)yrinic acid a,c-diamide adenosyltransferase [bacterium]|nr:cob(I)yrinic acid a,c-diamide adenosyltransferase [bacterium]MCB9476154.1 cob(I)yrinic acid a,c-diamide adenosyltransferase [Deltaproteobacteria bacterium]
MAKFSITTKTGDEGMTRLYSGEKVFKDSERPTVYGAIDELEAILGVCRVLAQKPDTKEALLYIQRQLFRINGELATTAKKLDKVPRVDQAMLDEMDRRRDALEETVELPNGFIVSGESLSSGFIDIAKTVARRCERMIVTIHRDGVIDNALILVWFNRLSDYLYLLGRHEGGEQILVKEE